MQIISPFQSARAEEPVGAAYSRRAAESKFIGQVARRGPAAPAPRGPLLPAALAGERQSAAGSAPLRQRRAHTSPFPARLELNSRDSTSIVPCSNFDKVS